jgi:hypothetical protein
VHAMYRKESLSYSASRGFFKRGAGHDGSHVPDASL